VELEIRITSRSPISLLANRAVPPFSEDEHLKIRVLPQFSTIVCSALRASPLAFARGRPFGRPTTLRVIVSFRVAS
jgi:hypothetical protein